MQEKYLYTQFFTYYNDNQNNFETWPFNQDFHLLINLAIGGTWGGQQGIDDNIFPVKFEIDYVRVFEEVDLSMQEDPYPKSFIIKGTYPNPFNPSTQIEYVIPDEGIVNIKIYDVNGRIVKNLVDLHNATIKASNRKDHRGASMEIMFPKV